jgi:glycosyltransferase involved in cell wall biosynthesis
VTPAVTVLVPVFNRERFVDDAIRSVVEQDFADFELLLVDDGSTDGTPARLDAWTQRDARVVVVTSPVNRGIPEALNLGLAQARGRYVARLDSDDLMMPRRLAGQVAVLDARPDVALVSSAYDIVDLDGRHLATWTGEPPELTTFFLNFFNVVGGGGQVMFRLADVRAEGGFCPNFPSTEDYDLWVRLLRRGRIETLPLVGMTKRTHADQSLRRYADVKRTHWTAIMRASLEPYLQRPVRDHEIAALITLWRHDDGIGTSRIADAVMREALGRLQREVPDAALLARARRRIAWQWYFTARALLSRGHPVEAATYCAHAVRWRIARRQSW